MVRRVLVTRPEPGAARTVARLETAGYEPVALPLTRIVPVAHAETPDAARYDAVAATSANAIRHAPPALLAALAGKPFHAVGRATAEAATEAGLDVAGIAAGDAEALASVIVAQESAGARILYLCGHVRTQAFEIALVGTPVTVELHETYDTRQIDYSDDAIARIFRGNAIDAALVYSAASAAALAALTGRKGLLSYFAETVMVCISGRAAAGFGAGAEAQCVIAGQPDEEGMMRTLATLG